MATAPDDIEHRSNIVSFTRAERKGSHVLIALYGLSGSGKTLSAIYLARGLVGPQGRIGVLDTESERAKIYASEAGGFMHADLTAPFTPERYIEAIEAAEAAGFDALVIDSASHEWEGLGGILEAADGSNKTGLGKWAAPKARHKKFVQKLLHTRMHLIICLRAKEKLVQVEVPDGQRTKKEIVSAGMVAIQAKDFIFEMTCQFYMPVPQSGGRRGVPEIEKCPKDLLGAFPEGEQISIETGARLREWVLGGVPIDHEFERMKRAAEEAAGRGSDAIRAHWKQLGQGARTRLAPLLANLRSIATAADEERAREDEERRSAASGRGNGQQPRPTTFNQAGPVSPPAPPPPDDPFDGPNTGAAAPGAHAPNGAAGGDNPPAGPAEGEDPLDYEERICRELEHAGEHGATMVQLVLSREEEGIAALPADARQRIGEQAQRAAQPKAPPQPGRTPPRGRQ